MGSIHVYSILLASGKKFPAKKGESILNSATLSGVNFPYSCKSGRCSACKCKVLNGVTHAFQPEIGLTDQERVEGWVLSCVRSAESDIEIEIDDLGGVHLPAPKTWPCRISEIKRLAPDVVQVFLRLPPAADFQFIPGQYIDVIGMNGIRRSYSLANYSFEKKILELHIRAVENGAMSKYWFNIARPNDLLRIHGPLGTFFIRETLGVDLIFLATGTGIAPVKAMLESIGHLPLHRRPNSVTVLWGGRHQHDFYMDLNVLFEYCTYFAVKSRADESWAGATGYVQDVLFDVKSDLKNASVYACGSNAMIRSAQVRLVEAGLMPKNFYSDAFVSSGNN